MLPALLTTGSVKKPKKTPKRTPSAPPKQSLQDTLIAQQNEEVENIMQQLASVKVPISELQDIQQQNQQLQHLARLAQLLGKGVNVIS